MCFNLLHRGEYYIPRGDHWEIRFLDFLTGIGCDGYGRCIYGTPSEDGGKATEIFAVYPRHFKYFPEDYEIRWIRYPFWIAWANKRISYRHYKDILNRCERSTHGKTVVV